jgi:DNA-binding NarL/FixJ family response regulator
MSALSGWRGGSLVEEIDDEECSPPAGAEDLIRVLIADSQAVVRASYRALLERDGRITVVGEAISGRHALALATETAPDVALLDLGLPGLDDVDSITAVVSHPALARVAVMLITHRETDARVLGALHAGATGVLSPNADPIELTRAVQLLARGGALFPAGVARRLLDELSRRPVDDGIMVNQLPELTDREREVVALVGLGLTNGEIAARLVVSPATAKTHVSRSMIKMSARDRTQLVVLAYESGLVSARQPAAEEKVA